MPLTDKQRLYQSHLEAAEERGQSIAAYAREHGISVAALYGERRRQRATEVRHAPSFVRVQEPRAEATPMALLQVRLPNGVSVALPTDQMPLADILQTLARL